MKKIWQLSSFRGTKRRPAFRMRFRQHIHQTGRQGPGQEQTQAAGEESKEASAAGETVTLKCRLTVSLDHPWGQGRKLEF